MTNAPDDFTLDAELATTDTWEDGFESGYADETDPEAEQTTGEMDLAARHALRRADGLRTELEDIDRKSNV